MGKPGFIQVIKSTKTTAMNLPSSVLQPQPTVKSRVGFMEKSGVSYRVEAFIRYDDVCRNGHNTFRITGKTFRGDSYTPESSGRIDEEIGIAIPELKPFLRWQLVSSKGPMHYIANSLYWAGKTKWPEYNLKYFRKTAVWPEATEEIMNLPKDELKKRLEERLPALMEEFKKDVESLGFVY